jgi:anti-sigma-K factor RskA
MSQETQERLLDLLEKRAFYGLTADEQQELVQFSEADDISLDVTASAITLAELNEVEPMPAHLRVKIETGADVYFADRALADQPLAENGPAGSAIGFWNWFGWAIAAAACIALAANIYWTRVNPPRQIVQGTPTPTPIQLTPEQMREQLLNAGAEIARAEIGPGKEAYRPTGDIVWSDAKQQGFIHVKGLPKNDPSKEQYQLWIFDENQDPKTPIDGGVFDVNSEGEVVIPVNAKLRVKGAKVFAITVERPGGVVVSKQEHVAALAKVET